MLSDLPQSAQNFASTALSELQLAQRFDLDWPRLWIGSPSTGRLHLSRSPGVLGFVVVRCRPRGHQLLRTERPKLLPVELVLWLQPELRIESDIYEPRLRFIGFVLGAALFGRLEWQLSLLG